MMEPTDKSEIQAKLKNFTYYFIRQIEDKFSFYLDIIEEHSNSKPTSTIGTAVSAATSFIPYIGKGASGTVKEGDTMVLKILDKKNAIAVSKIVYHHRDNKEEVRKMLIKAAYELFCCFEMQFLQVSCDGGPTRAMQKLGYDAGQRFLGFIIKNKSAVITVELILKSIVVDDSTMLNTLGIGRSGRTVKGADEHSWKTSDIYSKVGVYIKEINSCYIQKRSDLAAYGYRLKFSHESIEDVETNCKKVTVPYVYQFSTNLNDFEEAYPTLIEYLCTQNPDDYAKYDREMKYTEVMKVLQDYHAEVLADSANRYLDAAEHREKLHTSIMEENHKQYEEVTMILTKISERQESMANAEVAKEPLETTLVLVNQIVEEKIERASVGRRLGQELREELRRIDPTATQEFKRLKNHIKKFKF